MSVHLNELTPILTIIGGILASATVLDYVLKDQYKAQAFSTITSLARIGCRPRTLSFYGLTTLASAASTIFIVSMNGKLASLNGEGSFSQAFKSSGPLLLNIFLKVLLWDYLLALKSHFVIQNFREVKVEGANRASRIIAFAFIMLFDLWFTAIVTEFLLNWTALFQSTHVRSVASSAPDFANIVSDIFNEMNLVIKDSIQKAFYFLNGSLFMYVTLGFAALSSCTGKYINADEARKNLFKILGGLMTSTLAIILLCYYFAD